MRARFFENRNRFDNEFGISSTVAQTCCNHALDLAAGLGGVSAMVDGYDGSGTGAGSDGGQIGDTALEAGSLGLFHFNLAKVLLDLKDAQG